MTTISRSVQIPSSIGVKNMSRNISKLSGRKGLKENLFQKTKARASSGEVQSDLARDFLIGESTIESSRSFYEFLDTEHLEKKAWVCTGSSCLCSGDPSKVKAQLETSLGAGTVGTMTCLGHCYDANSYQLDGRNHSGNKNLKEPERGNYSISNIADTAILTDSNFANIEAIRFALKNVFAKKIEDTLNTVITSNLRGRGGAGFPTGLKWKNCSEQVSNQKYIVCNADEGDPGAFSDRYLLEQQPLRVIFGMIVAGWIAGAQDGVIYIRAEYPESICRIKETLIQLQEAGLLGKNILDSGFNFNVITIEGAGAYICGEETALIASIEGRRPEVDVRPPFPTVEGLYKQPTILNNVETFAAIQRILEMGGAAYASLGTPDSTGTKLISLDAGFNKPGIVEVEMGTPLGVLINKEGGGFKQPTKAVHIGGPLGGLVPIHEIDKLTVDYESFSEAGFLLGHAGMVCIPDAFPMIEYIQHLFKFTRDESCGKCFPCRIGATRGYEMLSQARRDEHLMNRTLLNDLLDTMQQGSLCALGGGLPLPIKNALHYFAEELQGYFKPEDTIPARQL